MSTKEIKLNLIQAILQIQEPAVLKKVSNLLKGALSNGDEDDEEEYDATQMSFEEWNEQFEDEGNLEEFIPEHGMTLGDFRRKIYEAERSEEYLTHDEFVSHLNTMRNKLKKKYSL